ncbi:MAG: signal peptidase I [Veillonellaceae bacterium]|jgi:signal peptidase I|nr:signal peptidase I [Mollicutes bacterium]NLP41427.1 signal peptidase I [Veillonellaceae bacterium]
MKIFNEIFDWIGSIAVALVIAIFINAFIFQPTRVAGPSMQPTLQDQDYIIISKLSHTLSKAPDYNDIVVIDSRVHRERSLKDDLMQPVTTYLNAYKPIIDADHSVWIKRIIGKPGDVLEFKDGKVYRNGIALSEPYTKEPMLYSSDRKVTVPEGHVFVMGDNRNNSSDSRHIGSVPFDHVLGTMVYRF